MKQASKIFFESSNSREKEVLAVADEYLDMQINSMEARSKIPGLYIQFGEFNDLTSEELNIRVASLLFSSDFLHVTIGHASYEDVLERRNRLARNLNQPLRRN